MGKAANERNKELRLKKKTAHIESAKTIFQVCRKKKVPVNDACEALRRKHPDLGKTGAARAIKAAFKNQISRQLQGSFKRKSRKYFYYGIAFVNVKHGKEEYEVQGNDHGEVECTIPPRDVDIVNREVGCHKYRPEPLRPKNVNHQPDKRIYQIHQLPKCHRICREEISCSRLVSEGTYGVCSIGTFRGIRVAIKEFKNPENLNLQRVHREVMKEVCVMLGLKSHPNLPLLLGVCIEETPFLLVSQFYGRKNGEMLTIHSALRDPLVSSNLDWLDIVSGVVNGLQAIHSSGFVHNDIKGDNVVLDERIDKFNPVIIDFGKAYKITENPSKRYKLNQEQQREWMKKHPWIAPEVIRGHEAKSTHSDTYSLGYLTKCIVKKVGIIPALGILDTVAEMCCRNPLSRPSLLCIRGLLDESFRD